MIGTKHKWRISLICLLFTFSSLPVWAGNWPAWRGGDFHGVSNEKNLPTEWSDTKNVQWKMAIPGRGHSSPIIWGNRIFLTTAIEGEKVAGAKAVTHYDSGQVYKQPDAIGADRKHKLEVICLDRDSGKILWERVAYEGSLYDDRHKKGSFASTTPITDGKLVYAFFGSEGIYAYDFAGKLAWQANFGGIANFGVGFSASPVLHQNLVIMQCDEDNGEKSFVVALDKNTGKEVWRKSRKGIQCGWSSPIIIQAKGRAELITSGFEWIVSYDPATGEEIWRTKGLMSNAVPTPLIYQDLVLLSTGYPDKRTIAVRLGGKGDLTDTNFIAWKYDKGTAYVPTPIIYGEYFFTITDRGVMTCLEARTGKVIYEGGRVPIPATFTASPVAYDGKILLTSEDGDTFVVEAGSAHKIIQTNSLNEPVYATPAIADGRIYLRSEQHLFCISKTGNNRKN